MNCNTALADRIYRLFRHKVFRTLARTRHTRNLTHVPNTCVFNVSSFQDEQVNSKFPCTASNIPGSRLQRPCFQFMVVR
jgi:hypothetical protein